MAAVGIAVYARVGLIRARQVRYLEKPWWALIICLTIPVADQVVARHPQAGLFSPGVSLLVLIAWPAATLVTAGVLLTRRDLKSHHA